MGATTGGGSDPSKFERTPQLFTQLFGGGNTPRQTGYTFLNFFSGEGQ